jgi:PPM family protein phosphatase
MRYVAAARTDVGRKRQGNEDSYCLAPELGLYVVADGMGGHAAGEVASRIAVDTIQQWIARQRGGEDGAARGPVDIGGSNEAGFLVDGIQQANRAIYEAAQGRCDLAGMGTTVVAALTAGDRVVLAHVGDSRIYRIRDGKIAQISRDHSLVQQQVDRGIISTEEAHTSQYRHMITRALGLREAVEIDLTEDAAAAGDVLVLCSDGLSDLLEDEEILAAVQDHPTDLEEACQALVDRANYKGGDDNITALLIGIQAGNGDHRAARGWFGNLLRPSRTAPDATTNCRSIRDWWRRLFRG